MAAVCALQPIPNHSASIHGDSFSVALGWPVWLAADAHTSAGNAALTPQQVIAHHNATLANIGSFGPRTRAVAVAELIQEGRLALPAR